MRIPIVAAKTDSSTEELSVLLVDPSGLRSFVPIDDQNGRGITLDLSNRPAGSYVVLLFALDRLLDEKTLVVSAPDSNRNPVPEDTAFELRLSDDRVSVNKPLEILGAPLGVQGPFDSAGFLIRVQKPNGEILSLPIDSSPDGFSAVFHPTQDILLGPYRVLFSRDNDVLASAGFEMVLPRAQPRITLSHDVFSVKEPVDFQIHLGFPVSAPARLVVADPNDVEIEIPLDGEGALYRGSFHPTQSIVLGAYRARFSIGEESDDAEFRILFPAFAHEVEWIVAPETGQSARGTVRLSNSENLPNENREIGWRILDSNTLVIASGTVQTGADGQAPLVLPALPSGEFELELEIVDGYYFGRTVLPVSLKGPIDVEPVVGLSGQLNLYQNVSFDALQLFDASSFSSVIDGASNLARIESDTFSLSMQNETVCKNGVCRVPVRFENISSTDYCFDSAALFVRNPMVSDRRIHGEKTVRLTGYLQTQSFVAPCQAGTLRARETPRLAATIASDARSLEEAEGPSGHSPAAQENEPVLSYLSPDFTSNAGGLLNFECIPDFSESNSNAPDDFPVENPEDANALNPFDSNGNTPSSDAPPVFDANAFDANSDSNAWAPSRVPLRPLDFNSIHDSNAPLLPDANLDANVHAAPASTTRPLRAFFQSAEETVVLFDENSFATNNTPATVVQSAESPRPHNLLAELITPLQADTFVFCEKVVDGQCVFSQTRFVPVASGLLEKQAYRDLDRACVPAGDALSLFLEFRVPTGTSGKYDLVLGNNLVLDPFWTSDINSDFDQNEFPNYPTPHDFNYTWVSPDGNLTLNGQLDWNSETINQIVSDQNLLLWIDFDDGNATHFFDRSRFRRDATKNGSDPTPPFSYRHGLLGTNGGDFNGSNNHFAEVATGPLVADKNIYTISAWYRRKDGSGSEIIYSESDKDTFTNHLSIVSTTLTNIQCIHRDTSGQTNIAVTVDKNQMIGLHHIALVRRSGTQFECYFDGNLVGTGSTGVNTSGVDFTRIAKRQTSLNGIGGNLVIDDVRVYDRALSVVDINNMFLAGALDKNLRAYWRFNDKNGSFIQDFSRYNRDANYIASQNDINARGLFDTNAYNGQGVGTPLIVMPPPGESILPPSGASTKSSSIVYWAKTSNPTTYQLTAAQYNGGVLGDWLTGVANPPNCNLPGSATGNRWYYNSGSGGNHTLCSDVNADDGKWHHVAIAFASDGSAVLYVDGRDANSAVSIHAPLSYTDNHLFIGSRRDSEAPSYVFDGKIEEFKIFDRTLSQAEVIADYNKWFSGQYYSKVFDGNSSGACTDCNFARMKVRVPDDFNAAVSSVKIYGRKCADTSCSANPAWALDAQFKYNAFVDLNNGTGYRGQYYQYRLDLDFNKANANPLFDFNQTPRILDVNVAYYSVANPAPPVPLGSSPDQNTITANHRPVVRGDFNSQTPLSECAYTYYENDIVKGTGTVFPIENKCFFQTPFLRPGTTAYFLVNASNEYGYGATLRTNAFTYQTVFDSNSDYNRSVDYYDFNATREQSDRNLSITGIFDANRPSDNQEIGDANLVLWLDFEDANSTHFLDKTRYRSDFNKNGGVGTEWLGIRGSRAVSFDGVNDHLLRNFSSSEPTNFSIGSWGMWIKSSYPTISHILARENSGNEATIAILSRGQNPRCQVRLEGDESSQITVSSNFNLDANWHHVQCVHDGSTLSVYIDGVFDVSTAAVGTVDRDSPGLWSIGHTVTGAPFASLVDDVRVYNRALSAADINRIVMDGILDKNLRAYWKFDDANATHIQDHSLNNFDLNYVKAGNDINAAGLFDSNAYRGQNGGKTPMVPTGSSILLTNKPFTILLWARTSSSNTYQMALSHQHNVSGFELGATDASGGIICNTGSGIKWFYYGYLNQPGTMCSSVAANDGRWHHVAVSGNASGGTMYVDGVDVNSVNSNTTNLNDIAVALSIGARNDESGANFHWNGMLDEVRIFDRMLSAAEIVADYNAWRNAHYYSKIFDSNSTGILTGDWNYVDLNADVNAPVSGVRMQVRSCDDAACNGESFYGSDGTASTYYQFGGNGKVLLTNVPDNRYFQYKLFLDFNNASVNNYQSLPKVSLADVNWGSPVPNSPPDVNLVYPTSRLLVGTRDGNSSIDFNVSDDANYVYADIYWSTSPNTFQNLIVQDLNLYYYLRNPTVDINCTNSGGTGFVNTRQVCHYDWNTLNLPTTRFYLDINVSDSSDANDISSSIGKNKLHNWPTTSDGGGLYHYPMVRTADGNLWMVYLDVVDGNSGVFVTRSDNNGTTWRTPVDLQDRNASSIQSVTMDINSTNGLHIAWSDTNGTQSDVHYRACPAGSLDCLLSSNWSADLNLSQDNNNSLKPSLTIGPDGNVHVAWNTNVSAQGQPVYTQCAQNCGSIANWSAPIKLLRSTTVNGTNFDRALVRVDAQNRVGLAFTYTGSFSNGRLDYAQCTSNCTSASNWSTTLQLTLSYTNAVFGFDANNTAIIVARYSGFAASYASDKLFVCNGDCTTSGGWVSSDFNTGYDTVFSLAGTSRPNLSFDFDKNTHFVWTGDGVGGGPTDVNTIRRRSDGTTGAMATLVNGTGNLGAYIRRKISWGPGYQSRDIAYLKSNGVDYNIQTLSTALGSSRPRLLSVSLDANRTTADHRPKLKAVYSTETTLSSCRFTYYENDRVRAYGTVVPDGNSCSFQSLFLRPGTTAYWDINATNAIGGISDVTRTNAFTYSTYWDSNADYNRIVDFFDYNSTWEIPDRNLTLNGQGDWNTTTPNQYLSDNNLVAWIDFEDSNSSHVMDKSRYKNDFNILSSPLIDDSGILGSKAGEKQGTPTGRFGSPADSARLNFSTGSWGLWAKSNTTGYAGNAGYLFNRYNTVAATAGILMNYGNTPNCVVRLEGSEGTERAVLADQVIDLNWHHYFCTFDGSTLRMFVDGVLQADTDSNAGTIDADSFGGIYVFAGASGFEGVFSGKIDEVRVYDRALTADDINRIYLDGVVDRNLLAYYAFNDRNASRHVQDLSVYNRDLNFVGDANASDINAAGLWDSNAAKFVGGGKGFQSVLPNLQNKPFTIASWMKTTDTGSDRTLLSMYAVFGTNTIAGGCNGAGANGSAYYNPGTSSLRMCSSASIADGRWHQVVVTGDTSSATMYVDGVDVNSVNGNATPQTGSGTYLTLGASFGTDFAFHYSGLADEVKIFDRKLSAAEIVADYNRWRNAHYYSKVFDSNALGIGLGADWNSLTVRADINAVVNRVRFQVRSCTVADCTGIDFTGPDSTSATYYDYNSNNPVALDVKGFRYFQYKLYLDFNNANNNDYASLPRVWAADINYAGDANAPTVVLFYPLDGNATVDWTPTLRFRVLDDGAINLNSLKVTIDSNVALYPDANLSCGGTPNQYDCNYDANMLFDSRPTWRVDVNDMSNNSAFDSNVFRVLRIRNRTTLQIGRQSATTFDANLFVHAIEPAYAPWAFKFVFADWNAPAMSPDYNERASVSSTTDPGDGSVFYWKLGALSIDANYRINFDLNSILSDYNLHKAWIVGG